MELVECYRVPYADTDQMGVVYYANYFIYYERSRNAYLRKHGFPYSKFESLGIMFPVIEAHANYISPATYDDELSLFASLQQLSLVKIRMDCEIRKASGQLISQGYTIHVGMNKVTKKPLRVENYLKELLNS